MDTDVVTDVFIQPFRVDATMLVDEMEQTGLVLDLTEDEPHDLFLQTFFHWVDTLTFSCHDL